ncbi:MFS transporter [Evansella tamaricis]|uniref:MFS transporter n=1 Tax=Evansella tamaricis TaxID=2069301 RepID=A0ABS6JE13_9BACI|nr:MFS transporter [Evansella tamaricis]MBU9711919.1 MFS transporter [Evansella tamaricis]
MRYTYKHTLHACYIGFITQAIINNLGPLLFIIFHDAFQISFEMIGRLILINFGIQIAADLLTIKYADRIGYRTSAVLAHVFSAVGLIGLGVFPLIFPDPYMGLVVAVMIYAMGGGIIEVLISPIVDSLPGDAKASAMSLLHSFYCWGQVAVVIITTTIIALFGTDLWYLLPILWATIPIYNFFRFMKVPLIPTLPEGEKMSLKQLFSSRLFLIALLLMMAAGSSELTMAQWSSFFAEKGLEVPKIMGDLLGPCLFAVFMGIGRTVYGFWGHKMDLSKTLLASGVLCVLCYATASLVQIPIVALMAVALCGLSISLMWPGTFSLTAASFPKGGTAMFGALAIFGDVGAAVGPWMAGVVSDLAQKSSQLLHIGSSFGLTVEQTGLKTGMFVSMIFPLLMIIGILLLRQEKKLELPK